MKQIFNIFRKDARRHWIEIVVFLVVLGTFIWNEARSWRVPTDFVEGRLMGFLIGALNVAVVLSACVLVVRVIQGESLVGDRQFWITRPYDWKKLLAAKVLFLLVFIQVPEFLASIVLVKLAGFASPLSFLPEILFGQMPAGIFVALPVIVLAAVTPNIAQLLLALLLLGAYIAGAATLAQYIPSQGFSNGSDGLQELLFLIGCLAIILYQYARRYTFRSRMLMVGVALAIVIVVVATPYRMLINREYPLTASEQLPVEFAFKSNKPGPQASYGREENEINIPMKFSGVNPGSVVAVDAAMLTVERPDGASWNSGWKSVYHRLLPNQNSFNLEFEVKKTFFQQVKTQAAKARISLALTLFHDKEKKLIVATGGDFNVPDVGICSIPSRYLSSDVRCRYVIKSPTLVTTLVSSEITCPQPKDENGKVIPGITLYDFSGANDDPGPISPINILNLYLGSWDIRSPSPSMRPSVCPGTPLTFAQQEEIKKAQIEIVIPSIQLKDYAPTATSDSFTFGVATH